MWYSELSTGTRVTRDNANPRTHAQVERPTFAQLRAIEMTVVTATGLAVYQRPKTFDIRGPQGHFTTGIVRRMNDEKELNERNCYHTTGPSPNNPRLGETPEHPGLPGHPMAPDERRISGKEDRKTPDGERICWNYNSHLGCKENARPRARPFYGNYDQLSFALKIALDKRYGFGKLKKLALRKLPNVSKTYDWRLNRRLPGAGRSLRLGAINIWATTPLVGWGKAPQGQLGSPQWIIQRRRMSFEGRRTLLSPQSG